MPAEKKSKQLPIKIFNDVTAIPREVVVFIYDFENFTTFLSIPDIHRDVSRYLSFVDQQARMIFEGGDNVNFTVAGEEKQDPLQIKLIHEKFLGDGMMFVGTMDGLTPESAVDNLQALCVRAWNFKHYFGSKINRSALAFMPVADLPKRVRVGVTYGTVLELSRHDGDKEYVGYAINLAARLQKYAGSASFLASARLPRAHDWLPGHDFIKARAKQLRGRQDELVFVDKADFERCQKNPAEKELFEKIE